MSSADSDNHWALREFSAALLNRLLKLILKNLKLNQVYRTYKNPEIYARVTAVLASPLDHQNSSAATIYGAVYALNVLGLDVRNFNLNNLNI